MNLPLVKISTSDLAGQLNNPQLKIIDIRSSEAYNGWKMNNESRGGHIAQAKSLPMKWLTYFDWPDIVDAKEILPSDTLVLYGYDSQDIIQTAYHFRRAGYHNLYAYCDFVKEWCDNPDLPMSNLSRYQHLVSPKWLHSLITDSQADGYTNNNYIVCHVHYRNRNAYLEGHIPGAIDFDTNTIESPQTWNRRSSQELKKNFENAGISSNTTVILYGRNSVPADDDPFPGSSAGQLGAMRCAFVMLYAGVSDVRILNGGLQAWIDDGFEVSKDDTRRKPIKDFGVTIPQHPELATDIDEAKEILRSKNKNLVCVRSWQEYIGEVSGYNYIRKRGRIPGAVFANCGSDAYHMENYRNLDHTTREYHEIEKLWAQAGITADKKNAFYCGTGWRASEAFFNAWLMGWPEISVYDGGWFEWSNDDCNPYETGLPKKQIDNRR